MRGSGGGGEEEGRQAAEQVTIVVRLHHSSGPPMAAYLWIRRAHIDYQRGCGMGGGGWWGEGTWGWGKLGVAGVGGGRRWEVAGGGGWGGWGGGQQLGPSDVNQVPESSWGHLCWVENSRRFWCW